MPYVEDIRRSTLVREQHAPDEVITNSTQVVDSQVRSIPATIIAYLLSIVEILLAFRLVFRVFGASSANGFVNGIYAITAPLTAPFTGIFPNDSLAGATLEWSTIIALIVYALIGSLLISLFNRTTRSYATTA